MQTDQEPLAPLAPRLLFVMSVCSLATLALLWSARFLPMADLPQHEAQLALWLRMGEGGDVARLYELNLFTPYLFYALLGRLGATVLPVWAALRCILCLAALGLPWSLLVLLRRTRGDPYWALVGYPLVFGVSFYWGFLNFLLALPLGVLFLAFVYRHAEEPTRKGAILLGAAACGVFLCHPLVWAPFTLAAGLALTLGPDATWRGRAARAVPLAPSLFLAIAWQVSTRATSEGGLLALPDLWDWSPMRLGALPAFWLGYDRLAVGVVALLAGGVVASAGGITRDRTRWAVAAFALVLFLFAPSRFSGIDFLFKRFAVLVALFALVACEPREASRRRTVGRVLLVGAVLVWFGVLTVRFQRFQHEGHSFEAVTRGVPAGAAVLGLVADPKLDPYPGSPLLHFAGYLQVDRDLRFEPSFAHYRHLFMVFRPETAPRWAPCYPLEGPTPGLVAQELGEGDYSHVLVRSAQDPAERFPVLSTWKRVAANGAWVLFERR